MIITTVVNSDTYMTVFFLLVLYTRFMYLDVFLTCSLLFLECIICFINGPNKLVWVGSWVDNLGPHK